MDGFELTKTKKEIITILSWVKDNNIDFYTPEEYQTPDGVKFTPINIKTIPMEVLSDSGQYFIILCFLKKDDAMRFKLIWG
jgi:hypothetical protein